jgi:hypothetical protein
MLNEEEKVEEKEVDLNNVSTSGNLADSIKEEILLELKKLCTLSELCKLLDLIKTRQLKLY